MTQRLELNDHYRDRPRRWVFPEAEVLDIAKTSDPGTITGTFTITIRAWPDEQAAYAYEYIDEKEA